MSLVSYVLVSSGGRMSVLGVLLCTSTVVGKRMDPHHEPLPSRILDGLTDMCS